MLDPKVTLNFDLVIDQVFVVNPVLVIGLILIVDPVLVVDMVLVVIFVLIVEIGTFFRETEFTKFKMNYDNLRFGISVVENQL